MKKIFSTLLFLSILFYGFSQKKTNNVPVNEDKFFIKDWNSVSFSLEKLSNLSNETENLQLIDSCDDIYKGRQLYSLSDYYYYSIIDTTNYYSYVYFFFKDYVKSFILVNYNKEGTYIDDVTISSISGDWGYVFSADGRFANDSTIIQTVTEEKLVEGTSEASIFEYMITSLIRYKIVLKKDGHIQKDILRQYLPCK
jgi:hypothetical protein